MIPKGFLQYLVGRDLSKREDRTVFDKSPGSSMPAGSECRWWSGIDGSCWADETGQLPGLRLR